MLEIKPTFLLHGPFAKLRKAIISYVVVCPSAQKIRLPVDEFSWNFRRIIRKSVQKILDSYEKNNG
jgi:hypothetical protein